MDPEEVRQKIREFDKNHLVSDIIILGLDGAVTRIKFDIEEVEEQ